MFKFTEFIRIINSADDPLLVTVHWYARNEFYAFSALLHLNIKTDDVDRFLGSMLTVNIMFDVYSIISFVILWTVTRFVRFVGS